VGESTPSYLVDDVEDKVVLVATLEKKEMGNDGMNLIDEHSY